MTFRDMSSITVGILRHRRRPREPFRGPGIGQHAEMGDRRSWRRLNGLVRPPPTAIAPRHDTRDIDHAQEDLPYGRLLHGDMRLSGSEVWVNFRPALPI